MLELILFFGFTAAVFRCQCKIHRVREQLSATSAMADAVYSKLKKG